MRLAALLVVLAASAALAQAADPAEFELPAFAPDAGTEASPPPEPAPPPLVSSPRAKPTRKLIDPTWFPFTGSVAAIVAGLRDWYTGFEGFGGVVLGTPAVKAGSGRVREVEGWVWVPGVELTWARIAGPVCGSSSFCGMRWVGGAGFRAGYAAGLADERGAVAVRRVFFAQVTAQVAYVNLPSAPLVPGTRWAEAVFRFRVGANVNIGNASQRSWLVLHLTAFVEALAFGAQGTWGQLGASAGFAL